MARTNAGLLIMRIGLGILFLIAGLGKMIGAPLGPGIAGFSGMVWGSVLVAWLVALGEFFGSLSLLTGKGMTYATAWLALIMLGAIFMVAVPGVMQGAPMALIKLLEDTVVFTGLIGLMLTGPGTLRMNKE